MFRLIPFIFLVTLHLCNSQPDPKTPSNGYGDQSKTCPTADGQTITVGGWPGTPYKLTPFQDEHKNPDPHVPIDKVCRSDGHCIFSYTVDVRDITLPAFNKVAIGCVKQPDTKWLSYGGKIPGDTFIVPSGHELLVRFTNNMGELLPLTFPPCNTTARTGRPFSCHHHGSASLAPYDGWAEDETCYGETKEYIYPCNRPTTQWYHDHALHTTADNAYLGLAGFFVVSAKVKHGGCGEPYNLENMEDKFMLLQDKVLNKLCQLFIQPTGVHLISLYGDMNVVSGKPYPFMNLQAKWYRFRFLDASISRPFLLQIRVQNGTNYVPIQQNICYVFATDGGYRPAPVLVPAKGMFIGVAERYEMACDFSNYAGQTLYWWNDRDTAVMKDVPYFCYSHLLVKMNIGAVNTTAAKFQPNLNTPVPEKPITRVLNDSDINLATAMANKGQFHREFQFGRGNGHWVINGETWDTAKIASNNTGQNTWELWKMQAGGGWFHPVHIHLIDFYILLRLGDGGLRPYEVFSPKDVMYLGPGNVLYVLARYGAHKGSYMFHCHNLIHEDSDMMRAFTVVNSTQGPNNASAQPFIPNPLLGLIYSNYIYADPMLNLTAAKPTNQMPALNAAYLTNIITVVNPHRIFYPNDTDKAQFGKYFNPWQAAFCSAQNISLT